MKKFILFILLTFLSLPCLAEEVIYLKEKRDKEASKILYEYLKTSNTTEFIELAKITQEVCYAIFQDLNSDGIDEVIGFVSSSAYQGTAGYSLFILQKNSKNKYDDIAYIINFYPSQRIIILDSKTNGYNDINIYGNKQEHSIVINYLSKYKVYVYK